MLDLAEKIDDLGVKRESLFYWIKPSSSQKYFIVDFDNLNQRDEDSLEGVYPAYTVSEFGEMLPANRENHELALLKHKQWHYGYCDLASDYPTLQHWIYKQNADTEADGRAKLLINNLIKIEEVNGE